MKKLFSAATSLIMAATAVAGSVVPLATGAADANKAFELRAFEGASTTISADAIAAGDVTVPIGVYLVENTADTQSLNFQFTIKGKTAGADPTGVKFDMFTAGTQINAEAKDYTVGGETYTTNILINFASTLSKNAKGAVRASLGGEQAPSVAENNKTAGTDYAYAGYAWIPSKDGYAWAGATSDEFPVIAVNVTFPKGTAQGTYTLDFCDYAYDADHPDNMSNMVEAGTTKYTTKNGNLSLKTVDIVIGDAGEVEETTTAAPAVVTTTTAAPVSQETTTTKADTTPSTDATPAHSPESEFTPVDDFVVDMNNGGAGYKFTLDEIKANPTFDIPVKISQLGNHKTSKLIAKLGENPAGITVTSDDNYNYAFEPAGWELNGETYYCTTLQTSGDPADADSLDLDSEILILTATVDTNTIKAGTYTYSFARFDVAEDGTGKNEISPLVIPAVIEITDGDTPVETTTAAPVTTTAAPVATTTAATPVATTTATPTGDAIYGDANDNGVVNIADVVVLNKWLNNNADYAITAQGKVNADCVDPKGGDEINASDSDAIIRSIVHRITLPTTSDALKADQAKD